MKAAPVLRRLGAEDGRAWLALMLAGVRELPDAFLSTEDELLALTPDDIHARIERSLLHGLFDGDRLVGVAGLNPGGPRAVRHRAEVGPFHILPEWRGRGLADRLMEAVVSEARARGIAWLDLWVAAGNGRALAFYARHGFQRTGFRADAVRVDGVPCDDVLMARSLEAVAWGV